MVTVTPKISVDVSLAMARLAKVEKKILKAVNLEILLVTTQN